MNPCEKCPRILAEISCHGCEHNKKIVEKETMAPHYKFQARKDNSGTWYVFLYGTSKEIGRGKTEREAWEMAKRNTEYLIKNHEQDLDEINNMLQYV
jgi:hypothetical protein